MCVSLPDLAGKAPITLLTPCVTRLFARLGLQRREAGVREAEDTTSISSQGSRPLHGDICDYRGQKQAVDEVAAKRCPLVRRVRQPQDGVGQLVKGKLLPDNTRLKTEPSSFLTNVGACSACLLLASLVQLAVMIPCTLYLGE